MHEYYSLCDRYDNIATKVYETPQTTADMVELVEFLNKVILIVCCGKLYTAEPPIVDPLKGR